MNEKFFEQFPSEELKTHAKTLFPDGQPCFTTAGENFENMTGFVAIVARNLHATKVQQFMDEQPEHPATKEILMLRERIAAFAKHAAEMSSKLSKTREKVLEVFGISPWCDRSEADYE